MSATADPPGASPAAPAPAPRPLVVLLHGLARRHGSMASMARYLRRAGWDTWARSYPSRRLPLDELAARLREELLAVAADRPLFAVTHSMGGIVLRHLGDPRLRWQRLVMLAPPNQGSQLAAALVENPRLGGLFGWFYGPAGKSLASAAADWPPPPAPFAVIAGTRRFSLGNPTSWALRRRFPPSVPNDGTVAVAETRLEGMAAFAEVDASHTWIMDDARVQQLTARFLAGGTLGAAPR
jgi:hypothetical protein